ncbi:MAG: hypothetical protein ACRDIY_14195, partial [Chloroflexota bacterium]
MRPQFAAFRSPRSRRALLHGVLLSGLGLLTACRSGRGQAVAVANPSRESAFLASADRAEASGATPS